VIYYAAKYYHSEKCKSEYSNDRNGKDCESAHSESVAIMNIQLNIGPVRLNRHSVIKQSAYLTLMILNTKGVDIIAGIYKRKGCGAIS